MESPTSQRWAARSAVVNLVLGVAGLYGPLLVGGKGLLTFGPGLLLNALAFNWAHSLIHLVLGLYGLAASRTQTGTDTYGWTLATTFGLLFVLGLLGAAGPLAIREADGITLVLDIATNGVVHLLHALFALVGVAILLSARSRAISVDAG